MKLLKTTNMMMVCKVCKDDKTFNLRSNVSLALQLARQPGQQPASQAASIPVSLPVGQPASKTKTTVT